MSFFERGKSNEELAARLNPYISQTFPTVPVTREDATPEAVEPEARPPTDLAEPEGVDEEGESTAEWGPLPVAGTGPATNQFTAVRVAPPPTESTHSFLPSRPESIEEAGLQRAFVTDLVLRTMYQSSEVMGAALAEQTALSFVGILAPILEALRRDAEVEIKGQRGVGDAGYVYAVTEKGGRHARDSMERLTYAGPAPVPLDDYVDSVLAQTVRNVLVTQETIRAAFQDLIIEDTILDMVGPAVNSGSSMFLFGYPGNGKTAIAERITKLMGDFIFIPHAVEIGGAIVTVFDAVNHEPYEEKGGDGQPVRANWDPRWVKIQRPVVMVGGELTMNSLDLLYNETGKYYEAPLQMKANGGMFLIDDFGRQMIRPQDLLNRWIVPLEKRVDFLNLVTGKKIAIPFEQLIVFSTNLDPKDLVDDAFLRRIKFKINVIDPNEDQFREIFQLMCNRRQVAYDERMFQYILDTFYRPSGRPLRMCQPRDIIEQIIAIAKYKMVPAQLTEALVDRACETYFVSIAG